MQIDIAKLETLFRLLIPWDKDPKYGIGDKIFSKHLNLVKEVKGVLWRSGWFYLVPHNGKLFQVSEKNCYLIIENYQIAPFPYRAFGLGDRVSCPLRNVEKSLILGIVFAGGWRYYLQNNEGELITSSGGMIERVLD